jgi:hypothetical protein
MTAQLFENFIIGYWDGRYRLLKSAGIDKILSIESMHHLQQLGGHLEKPVTTATLLCKDKLFAISFLKPDRDEMSRPTVWNHTVLISCTEVLGALKSIWNGNVFIKEANGKLASPLPQISVDISP